MDWENKVKMVEALNQGNYKDAVDILSKEPDWDSQALDMFVTGFDLTQYALCKSLNDRIQKVKVEELEGFRARMRMAILQNDLESLVGTNEVS